MSRRFKRPSANGSVSVSQCSILHFFGQRGATVPPPAPVASRPDTRVCDVDVRTAASGPLAKRMKRDKSRAIVDLTDDVPPKIKAKSALPSAFSTLPPKSSATEDTSIQKITKGTGEEGAKTCYAGVIANLSSGAPSGAPSPETDGGYSPGRLPVAGLECRPESLASGAASGHINFRNVRAGVLRVDTGQGGREEMEEMDVARGYETEEVALPLRRANEGRKCTVTPGVGETFQRGGGTGSIKDKLLAKAEEEERVVVREGRGWEKEMGTFRCERGGGKVLDKGSRTVGDDFSGRDSESRMDEAAGADKSIKAGGHWSGGERERVEETTGVVVGGIDSGDGVDEHEDSPNEEISEYELQRLERIRKNQAFMNALGLGASRPLAPPSSISSGGGGASRRKKMGEPGGRPKSRAAMMPLRRSTRAKRDKPVDDIESNQEVLFASRVPDPEDESQPVLEEINFDDSTVLKYLCGEADDEQGDGQDSATAEAISTSKTTSEGARVMGMRALELDQPLSASGLSTIYSMHFRDGGGSESASPALLAAGGKGGVVALFSARQLRVPTTRSQSGPRDDEDDKRTLMIFKAHKGWVSSVRFLGGGEGGGGGVSVGGYRLLSSANDSVVKLWDISKSDRGLPRLLCTANDLHPTSKGIFSMDAHGTLVATGSKDATVAIASLRPAGLAVDRVLGDPGGSEAFHTKVIKGVSLRDHTTVASCGDDSSVCVSDVRVSTRSAVSSRLNSVHDGSCHTVRWHPLDENLLLTAGLDSTIKLFDLRRLDAPLHVFRGHCPYALARPRAIHRPEFLSSGRGRFNIITGGERSTKLSMYDASSGATVSRGVLRDEATALAVLGGGPSETDTIAAAMPGGTVLLLTSA